jgi:hypothetical protein
VSALPNIICESITVIVPESIAPSESVAVLRAGIFATLALWVGTPLLESCEPVDGGYRVVLREGSPSTALARQAKGFK